MCTSANPGGTPPESVALTEEHEVIEKPESADVSDFTKVLLSEVKLPDRSGKGDFLYAVDHCFVIKGKRLMFVNREDFIVSKYSDRIRWTNSVTKRQYVGGGS